MGSLIARLESSLADHPFAWVLLGLFIIAEYHNYQKGVTITRICELTGDHDTSYVRARTARQELDMICTNRSADDDQPEN